MASRNLADSREPAGPEGQQGKHPSGESFARKRRRQLVIAATVAVAVGLLPLVEPPDDLEARILDAVAVAHTRTPLHKKVLRGLAWAGSHAMRPQLAMAALFFLVIGSSLLLLRALLRSAAGGR